MINLTVQQEQEIINFYLAPHSLNDTVKNFNLKNRYQLKKILAKYKIEVHSKELSYSIRHVNTEKTNLDRYGRTNVGQFGSLEFLNSMYNKYNGIGTGSTALKDKIYETIDDKYNTNNVAKLDWVQEKIQLTNYEKYGGIGFASTELNEKAKQTCELLYGDKNFNNAPLRAKTNLELYGTSHPPRAIYKFEDITFDSFPEVCFYLYNKSNNKNIQRSTQSFTYEYDGRIWQYFPDFIINNELYEIKGDQFLAEDGTWQNPFNPEDLKIKAKYQCAVQNNVKILYSKDYQQYIDWFYENGYKKEDFKTI